MKQVVDNFTRFHPKPEEIFMSDPQEEPEFIKPYFGLRLFPVWHIGSNYLHEIAKTWYQYLLDKGVNFMWGTEVTSINFDLNLVLYGVIKTAVGKGIPYDELIFAVGKSGIDFAQQLSNNYNLPTEPKSVQIGVRFEALQKYFQKLIDISYDFKLYQKFDNVSLRSFCTNNNAAYVAVEETYGDVSYNGHAKKGEEFRNDMTNFGILMEIKGIENPFEWSRNVVSKLQSNNTGLYYSPNNTRQPALTSEGATVSATQISWLELIKVTEVMNPYFEYIVNFIDDMKKVFPKMDDDWGMYIPEVKYLSPEPLVDYTNLALTKYPNVHFAGDALSARGITVAGSQGIYIAEYLLEN